MSRPAHRQEDQKQAYTKSMTTNQKELSSHNEEPGPISTAEALEKVRYITIKKIIKTCLRNFANHTNNQKVCWQKNVNITFLTTQLKHID